jgi:NTP pyrophosphatase (non-canonical NTP hydrolase)
MITRDFLTYQSRARESAVYPGHGTFQGLVYCALKLNGEAGEVAEKIGKAWRDEGGCVSDERREALILELGDVLWYLANIAEGLETTLEFCAERNLAKLASRRARGTLRGSGDDR